MRVKGNMSARRLIIVGQLLALSIGIVLHSTEASNSSVVVASSRITDLSPSGVKVATIGDNEMRIKVTSDSYEREESEARGKDKMFLEQPKLKIMKRLRTMMMMLPFAIQLLQLPAAIATIKMSLLKSLLVAKMAIVLMLLSYLITMKQHDVTLLTQPQHHEHFYQTPHYSHDDDDGGWLGRWFGR